MNKETQKDKDENTVISISLKKELRDRFDERLEGVPRSKKLRELMEEWIQIEEEK